MAKFKVVFTASREMTAEEVREEYGELLGIEEDDDPFEKLTDYLDADDYDDVIATESWIKVAELKPVEKKK